MTCIVGGLPNQIEKVMQGSLVHARTLTEACLVTADRMNGVEGIHERLFEQSLMASIRFDQKQESPDTLGYNSDTDSQVTTPYDDDIDWRITGVNYNG